MTYNSTTLHERLMKAFTDRYPGFRAMRFVFSSEPGGGKSTLLASVPVPTGKMRIYMDGEDSAAYLDNGENGVDVYTPNRQQFRMKRKAFPTLNEYALLYQTILKKPETVGAVCIDNAAIFQDMITMFLMENAAKPQTIRDLYAAFNATGGLVNDGLIRTWSYNQDGNFWRAAKEIVKQLLLLCSKNCIHLLASTEEGNVWQNYGKKEAAIIGKKAKIWDVWYRYTDAIISLQREINSRKPPMGQLYPNQPKMRLQGFNPKFQMDWEGFIAELEASAKRTEADIPKEYRVEFAALTEEA